MLPKKGRIKREFFEDITRNSSVFQSPYFSLRYIENKQKKALFSCVISKKVEKKSIERHRIKRQVYEVIDSFLKKKAIKEGYSVIIYIRNPFTPLTFSQKQEVLLDVLRKVRIIA